MTTYVVRDAAGEYVAGRIDDSGDWSTGDCEANPERTPASDRAMQWDTREEAQAACRRATDRVLEREVE